jgi:CBS domain-containing protein
MAAMHIHSILATKGGNVFTVRPEQSVREAAALLARHNVGALIVVNELGHPVGVISERDIVRAFSRDERLLGGPVAEIMTRDVVTGLPTDDLLSVSRTMSERRIRHLPILDGGKLVGLVSIRDVVKAQRDLYQGAVDTLETQILAEGG